MFGRATSQPRQKAQWLGRDPTQSLGSAWTAASSSMPSFSCLCYCFVHSPVSSPLKAMVLQSFPPLLCATQHTRICEFPALSSSVQIFTFTVKPELFPAKQNPHSAQHIIIFAVLNPPDTVLRVPWQTPCVSYLCQASCDLAVAKRESSHAHLLH